VRPSRPPPPWHAPRALGVAGIVAALASLGASALVGGSSEALRVVFAMGVVGGVALAATLVRPPATARRAIGVAMQLVLPLGLAAGVFFLDPLARTYRYAALRQLHGDVASSRAGIAELLRLGRDFHGLSLVNLDFSGTDLSFSDLRGADLSHANLARTRLAGADVQGTSFSGAALAGADLEQVNLGAAQVGIASCDAQTRLPAGWVCDEGHLAKVAGR
jgi:hypothetical protein